MRGAGERVGRRGRVSALCAGVASATAGCATLVNDAMIDIELVAPRCPPLACTAENRRGRWTGTAPGTLRVRRSADALQITCRSEGGTTHRAELESTTEWAKHAASIAFLDLGVTDDLTEMHRSYPPQAAIACGGRKR